MTNSFDVKVEPRVEPKDEVKFSHEANRFNSYYAFVEEQLAHLSEPLKNKARREILLELSKEVAKIEEERRDISRVSNE
ncbi:hypothetical protein QR680_016926 [Steinernema hermaphroditum]|uniref:Uncharacterized protein n=1 Tax=Steinernema hermaphroditum TaxID=289476 RepID=A0AA39HER3_9BILA|nr:hypothetical protein QR680_016926 [Steinernema hermaphroditum]